MAEKGLSQLAGLSFAKMNGSGNDFIVADNREGRISPELMPALAKAVCKRALSVGADGLILLSSSDRVDPQLGPVDFAWDFFNSDGSSAEMCGNGGRCAARFATENGLAGSQMVFDTLAGPIRAWVSGSVVKLEMVQPFGHYQDLELIADGEKVRMHGINTGVPHAVVTMDDVSGAQVKRIGRAVRFHPHFSPAGSNVNFCQVTGGGLTVRTYERGVEDETLACGTGVVASALVAGIKGLVSSPVKVKVAGGETLTVHFALEQGSIKEVFLEGTAVYAFRGELDREAFLWMEQQD